LLPAPRGLSSFQSSQALAFASSASSSSWAELVPSLCHAEFASLIMFAVLSCHFSIIFISRKPASSMLIVGSLYMIQAIGWVLRLVSTPTMLHETSKFLDNTGQ